MTDGSIEKKGKNDQKSKKDYIGAGIGMGIALGAGIGVAVDDIAIGIAIGVALGPVLGLAMAHQNEKKQKIDSSNK